MWWGRGLEVGGRIGVVEDGGGCMMIPGIL